MEKKMLEGYSKTAQNIIKGISFMHGVSIREAIGLYSMQFAKAA
ncbi:MAG: hypothetical protein M0006_15710 [Magnetospirillum sp.]|nr:hypothetical protein [Magnetospirillum sp.]